jgi:hypothetical protein
VEAGEGNLFLAARSACKGAVDRDSRRDRSYIIKIAQSAVFRFTIALPILRFLHWIGTNPRKIWQVAELGQRVAE